MSRKLSNQHETSHRIHPRSVLSVSESDESAIDRIVEQDKIDQVEVSEDLALWSIDSSITISTQPLDEHHSLVTVTIPLAGRDRCFAQIVVNVNGP